MNKKIPMRQCVGCGTMKNKKEMMRVLKTADEGIILDKTGKKNGRGAYLCESMECLKMARKNRGLERSFKMSIPNEVYDNMEKVFSTEKKFSTEKIFSTGNAFSTEKEFGEIEAE